MNERSEHWNAAYADGDRQRSWYQEHAGVSLELLTGAGVTPASSVVDVGGGAGTLVDDLLAAGYRDVTVVDVAEDALGIARRRLGSKAAHVAWENADLLTWRPGRHFDVWHDRAVLHFLTTQADQRAYRAALLAATRPGSLAVIGVFGPAGPEQCSGLPVRRYSPEKMRDLLGPGLSVVASRLQDHRTPAGTDQQFLWTVARRS